MVISSAVTIFPVFQFHFRHTQPAIMATQDELQTLVLTTLDKQGSIEDSTHLKTVDGANVDQLALLGALNSLRSKDVRISFNNQYLMERHLKMLERRIEMCLFLGYFNFPQRLEFHKWSLWHASGPTLRYGDVTKTHFPNLFILDGGI
jgi:hypothetical protein